MLVWVGVLWFMACVCVRGDKLLYGVAEVCYEGRSCRLIQRKYSLNIK